MRSNEMNPVSCDFASTMVYCKGELALTTMALIGCCDNFAIVFQDGQVELFSCEYKHFFLLDVDG